MFPVALFTAVRKWEQPKCPSGDERIKKMWRIHAVEHYPAINRNEVLTRCATGASLNNVTLSDRAQTQKAAHVIPLTGRALTRQTRGDRSRSVPARG